MKPLSVLFLCVFATQAFANEDVEAAREAAIRATGDLATALFDSEVRAQLADEETEEKDEVPAYLKVLEYLSEPDVQFHIKGNEEGLLRAQVLASFLIEEPILYRFGDDIKKPYLPNLLLGQEGQEIDLVADYDNQSAFAALSFFQPIQEEETDEPERESIDLRMELQLQGLKGIVYYLRGLKFHSQGLDRDSKLIELSLECQLFEKNGGEEKQPLEPCFLKANYNKEKKRWDYLLYQVGEQIIDPEETKRKLGLL